MLERKRFLVLRIAITNIFILLIPALITIIFTVPAVKYFTKNILIEMKLFNLVKLLQIPIVIIGLAVVPFIVSLVTYKKNIKQDQTNEEFLFSLLAHIDTVVGVKNKRFYDFTCKKDKINPNNIFMEITQPILQMQEIIKNIVSFFELIKNNPTIKCSLFKVKENGEIDYFIYLDGQPTTEKNILNNPKSTASICIKRRKIIIVEDTSKKDAEYIKGEGEISNCKSIICYPVVKGSRIEFIISITSKDKNTFINKNINKYRYALEQFSKRITLESYLECIKEAVNETKQEA